MAFSVQDFQDIDRLLESIVERQKRINEHLRELVESDRERRHRERASGYFGRLLRGVRVVAAPELDRLLDGGRVTGA